MLLAALLAVALSQESAVHPWQANRAALVREALDGLAAGAAVRSGLRTAEEVHAWQAEVRTAFLEAMTPLPPMGRPAPDVRTVRRLVRDGYSIEHLLIESRPGMHVTAHLYLPDGATEAAPVPGVLVACGHAQPGKAHPVYQKGAAALALHGLAALVFDPLDQGERMQAVDDAGNHVRWGTRAHNVSGARALLVGWSQAGLEAWDATLCLDALAARSEVDAARLGMCGNSGGGTQTAQLFAIDERLDAAAPACYVTSLADLARTIGPQDAEQNLFRQLQLGLDHADYVAVRAPAPALLCARSEDFFPIDGTRTAFSVARAVYEASGAPEALELAVSDGTHGWNAELIGATVTWMARWLDGRTIAFEWSDALPMEPEVALVTENGRVLDLDDERSVHALLKEEAARCVRLRAGLGAGERIARARSLAGVRQLDELTEPVEWHAEKGRAVGDRFTVHRVIVDGGFVLPAARYIGLPTSTGPRRLVIGGGAWRSATGELPPPAAPREVLWIDPLALGDAEPDEGSWYGSFGPAGRDAAYGVLLGRPLVGRQAEQILQVARALGQGGTIDLVAEGPAAIAALHAAAFEPQLFGELLLDVPLTSWEELFSEHVDETLLPYVVPGALTAYDLPDLAQPVSDR